MCPHPGHPSWAGAGRALAARGKQECAPRNAGGKQVSPWATPRAVSPARGLPDPGPPISAASMTIEPE